MIVERLAWVLTHSLWQGVLIAGLTAIALRPLHRRSAQTRYAAAVAGLVLMIAAPAATFIFYSSAEPAFQRLLRLAISELDPSALSVSLQSANSGAWMQWLVLVWICGVTISAVRWVIGWRITRGLIRNAIRQAPAGVLESFERIRNQLGLAHPVRLLLSAQTDGPAAMGCLRPVVLLPMTAITGLNEHQLRAVFAHELAHIRRHDFAVNVFQRCVESLLFYHPLVWWLSARIRIERENCCDDLAVQVCGDVRTYAEALIALEDARAETPALALAAAGKGIRERILRLFGHEVEHRDWREGITAVIIVATLLVAGAWQQQLNAPQTIPPPSSLQPLRASIVSSIPVPAPTRVLASALSELMTAEPAPIQAPRATGKIIGQILSRRNDIRGIRIFAIEAHPDVADPVMTPVATSVTDREGRYSLEGLPAGRYLIAAGSLAIPAFYPGVLDMAKATIVNLAEGASLGDFNFEMAYPEVRELWGTVEVDDGAPLPAELLGRLQIVLSSARKYGVARPFTRMQGIFFFGTTDLQGIVPGDVDFKVAPLPLGYYLKSATYGNIDLAGGHLHVASLDETQFRIVITRTRPPGVPAGVKVSGRIADWIPPMPALELTTLTSIADQSQDIASTVAIIKPRDDGSFQVEGVPPGQYFLNAPAVPKDRSPARQTARFNVAGNDVAGLDLRLGGSKPIPPKSTLITSLKATVETDNGKIPEFEIQFASTRLQPQVKQSVKVSSKEFSASLPDGEYRVSISGLPKGYTLVSVTAGPLDLTEPFLVVPGGIADRFTGVRIRDHSDGSGAINSVGATIKLHALPAKKQ